MSHEEEAQVWVKLAFVNSESGQHPMPRSRGIPSLEIKCPAIHLHHLFTEAPTSAPRWPRPQLLYTAAAYLEKLLTTVEESWASTRL